MAQEMNILIVKKNKKIIYSENPTESSANTLSLWWLGQAGFYFKFKNYSILIDPYLSDSLAQKYKGKEFSHIRMMSTPVHPEQIQQLDFVFCTHGHSDHMDPLTLSVLARNNPICKFIVPKAEKATAIEKGVPDNQLITVNAGDSIVLNADIKLEVVPSAHEDLRKNGKSEFYYLGYILSFGIYTVYHSGDCVPYPGLSEKLETFKIDVALLPVNGRDKYRKDRGVPGNFTFEEAVELCTRSNIHNLIAHHFGMFSFNTVDVETLREKHREISDSLNLIIPEMHFRYEIKNSANRKSCKIDQVV
jgi:L-ascorbate metabolism protein UlaG (beta-lactamase superfamily)